MADQISLPKLPSDLDFWNCYLNSKQHDLVVERRSRPMKVNKALVAAHYCEPKYFNGSVCFHN